MQRSDAGQDEPETLLGTFPKAVLLVLNLRNVSPASMERDLHSVKPKVLLEAVHGVLKLYTNASSPDF